MCLSRKRSRSSVFVSEARALDCAASDLALRRAQGVSVRQHVEIVLGFDSVPHLAEPYRVVHELSILIREVQDDLVHRVPVDDAPDAELF